MVTVCACFLARSLSSSARKVLRWAVGLDRVLRRVVPRSALASTLDSWPMPFEPMRFEPMRFEPMRFETVSLGDQHTRRGAAPA
jgi:hypothetical protein